MKRKMPKGIKNIRVFASILAFVASIGVASSIMLPSYIEYNEYYTAAIKAKEEQKYLNSLPLEFKGIDAQLSDSVLYVNNGRAKPVEEDFIVKANFTEKGKEFSRILKPTEYTVTSPDNFATRGGRVIIEYTYVFQPELPDDAPEGTAKPEPIVTLSKAQLDLKLADVELTNLKILKQPYRVYYQEGMEFNPEGMQVEAVYNDGSKLTLSDEDIQAVAGGLTAGDKTAKVEFQGVQAEVPVTVVSALEYDDGPVTAIDVEGEIYIEEGKSIDTDPVPVTVRGTYLSGNKLILNEDQYTISSISGNEGVPADYSKRYIVTATLNGSVDITDSYIAYVKKAYEIENATLSGSLASETVMNYVYKDGGFIQDDNVTAVKAVNGETITINIPATQTLKSEFRLSLASTTVKNGGFAPIALNNIMSLTVNGMPVGIPASSITPHIQTVTSANQQKAVFTDYRLGGLPLVEGDNEIVIKFRNINSGTRVYLDKIGMVTGGKGSISGTIGAYLVNCMEKGVTPQLLASEALHWNKPFNGSYLHGMCSDGTYIYGLLTSWKATGNPRYTAIAKYNPETGEIINWNSGSTNYVLEASAGISYKDGKVIFFGADGKRWAIDAATFSSSSKPVQYMGYEFKEWSSTDVLYKGQANESPVVLGDVFYNQYLDKYAVLRTNATESDFRLRIYDGDKETYKDVALRTVSGMKLKRVTGSSEYIYINYSKDGQYQPIVQIYDWTGEFVGQLTIPGDEAAMQEAMGGATAVPKFTGTNTQGLVFHQNKFYVSVLRFSQNVSGISDSYNMVEIKMGPDALTGTADMVGYTLGEYVAAVDNYNANLGSGDVAKTYNVTAEMLANGFLPISGSEVKDIVYSGKNYYVSATQKGGQIATVYQVNSKSMAITAISNKVAYDDCLYGDNSKLYVQDDTLYMLSESGKKYAVKLADFKNGCEFSLVSDSAGVIGTVGATAYNADIKRLVSVSDNTLSITDATDQYVAPITVDLASDIAAIKKQYAAKDIFVGVSVASVTCDEKYVYVSYKATGASDIALSIYDYNGNKVGTSNIAATIAEMPTNENIYQVSSVFIQEGQVMALITNTANGTGFVYAINAPVAI